jgi:Arc/MetJ-type ribon-helix-helix transcriptional regulator
MHIDTPALREQLSCHFSAELPDDAARAHSAAFAASCQRKNFGSRADELDRSRRPTYAGAMEVHLTADQESFIRQAIESGRLQRVEDAVEEAMSLWEERERSRAEILLALDGAEASLARGEGRIITDESMRTVAAQVKQRGRARLVADQNAPR